MGDKRPPVEVEGSNASNVSGDNVVNRPPTASSALPPHLAGMSLLELLKSKNVSVRAQPGNVKVKLKKFKIKIFLDRIYERNETRSSKHTRRRRPARKRSPFVVSDSDEDSGDSEFIPSEEDTIPSTSRNRRIVTRSRCNKNRRVKVPEEERLGSSRYTVRKLNKKSNVIDSSTTEEDDDSTDSDTQDEWPVKPHPAKPAIARGNHRNSRTETRRDCSAKSWRIPNSANRPISQKLEGSRSRCKPDDNYDYTETRNPSGIQQNRSASRDRRTRKRREDNDDEHNYAPSKYLKCIKSCVSREHFPTNRFREQYRRVSYRLLGNEKDYFPSQPSNSFSDSDEEVSSSSRSSSSSGTLWNPETAKRKRIVPNADYDSSASNLTDPIPNNVEPQHLSPPPAAAAFVQISEAVGLITTKDVSSETGSSISSEPQHLSLPPAVSVQGSEAVRVITSNDVSTKSGSSVGSEPHHRDPPLAASVESSGAVEVITSNDVSTETGSSVETEPHHRNPLLATSTESSEAVEVITTNDVPTETASSICSESNHLITLPEACAQGSEAVGVIMTNGVSTETGSPVGSTETDFETPEKNTGHDLLSEKTNGDNDIEISIDKFSQINIPEAANVKTSTTQIPEEESVINKNNPILKTTQSNRPTPQSDEVSSTVSIKETNGQNVNGPSILLQNPGKCTITIIQSQPREYSEVGTSPIPYINSNVNGGSDSDSGMPPSTTKIQDSIPALPILNESNVVEVIPPSHAMSSIEFASECVWKICPVCNLSVPYYKMNEHGVLHANQALEPFFFECTFCKQGKEQFETFNTLIDHIEVRHNRNLSIELPNIAPPVSQSSATASPFVISAVTCANSMSQDPPAISVARPTEKPYMPEVTQHVGGPTPSSASTYFRATSDAFTQKSQMRRVDVQKMIRVLIHHEVKKSLSYMNFPESHVSEMMRDAIRKNSLIIVRSVFSSEEFKRGDLGNLDAKVHALRVGIRNMMCQIVCGLMNKQASDLDRMNLLVGNAQGQAMAQFKQRTPCPVSKSIETVDLTDESVSHSVPNQLGLLQSHNRKNSRIDHFTIPQQIRVPVQAQQNVPQPAVGTIRATWKEYHCAFCSEKCYRESEMKEHMQVKHNFNCEFCGDRFSSSDQYACHALKCLANNNGEITPLLTLHYEANEASAPSWSSASSSSSNRNYIRTYDKPQNREIGIDSWMPMSEGGGQTVRGEFMNPSSQLADPNFLNGPRHNGTVVTRIYRSPLPSALPIGATGGNVVRPAGNMYQNILPPPRPISPAPLRPPSPSRRLEDNPDFEYFSCSSCNIQFRSEDAARDHLIIDHGVASVAYM